LEGNKSNVCLKTSFSYGLTLTVHLLDSHFILLPLKQLTVESKNQPEIRILCLKIIVGASKFAFAGKTLQPVASFLTSVFRFLDMKNDSVKLREVAIEDYQSSLVPV